VIHVAYEDELQRNWRAETGLRFHMNPFALSFCIACGS
jgi:hypothetical protein